jgi:hypothetical protein
MNMLFTIKNYSFSLIKLLLTSYLILAIPAFARPADAKKNNHHHGRHRENLSNIQYDHDYLIGLNQIQKTNLIDLLRGRDNNNYILNPGIRIEINNQINSLPPGIQKRLAKGKPLPYGIAKQVILPQEVNSYLKLPPNYRIVVLGSSVVVLNSTENIILDILQAVF